MLRMLRSVELLAAALFAAFAFLRCMELTNVYCQSRLHLGLHLGLALLAACRPGLPRVTLLSVLYGVMYHRLDVQVYAAPEAMRLDGAIVVIAGASNGIGLALAHELARLNATTVLGCRNLTKCEIVRPAGARCVQLDLADLRSVVQFASEVRSSVPRVDFLVHNAGFVADGLHGRTVQGFELSFGVMHLAHHLLTRELWSLLQRPSPSALPARVVSHASAAFMTGDFSSLLAGDGAGDLRGEVMDGCLSGSSSVQDHLLGTFHTLAKLYLGVPLPRGKAALCPLAGVYSRAKLAQVYTILVHTAHAAHCMLHVHVAPEAHRVADVRRAELCIRGAYAAHARRMRGAYAAHAGTRTRAYSGTRSPS